VRVPFLLLLHTGPTYMISSVALKRHVIGRILNGGMSRGTRIYTLDHLLRDLNLILYTSLPLTESLSCFVNEALLMSEHYIG